MSRIVQFLLSRTTRRGVVVLAIASLLGGCASHGGFSGAQPGGVVQGGQGQALDQDLAGFLTQSPAGGVTTLPESPWGRGVEVTAEAPYDAASGRVCRRLTLLSADSDVRQAVACETSGGWEAQRLVTEVLSTGSAR